MIVMGVIYFVNDKRLYFAYHSLLILKFYISKLFIYNTNCFTKINHNK